MKVKIGVIIIVTVKMHSAQFDTRRNDIISIKFLKPLTF